MYEIKTGNYLKKRKINIDGNEWTMIAPGAGDELALSQADRRLKIINKKVEADTATMEDIDAAEALEARTFSIFEKMFNDGTPENQSVKDWIAETPLAVIYMIVEEIKKQSEEKDAAETATAESASS
jgi:hypothetical protein